MYERKYVFRYGDVNRYGEIKISTILDILQDISTRHSEFIGYGIKRLYSMNLAYLLKGWRIQFIEPLDYESDCKTLTGIMKIRHFETVRKYEIYQEGKLKLIATGNWFAFNTETKKIAVTPDEIKYSYDCITEEDNNLPFIRVREDETDLIFEYNVQNRDIDTNGHVNNVKSVELGLECLPEGFLINEMQVMYLRELLPEQTISINSKKDEDGYHIEIKNQLNETCVLLLVKEKEL